MLNGLFYFSKEFQYFDANSADSRTDKGIGDNLRIIFHISPKKRYVVYSLESPRQGDSNEYPQHMVLWRTDENYPSIIIKYPPYLFCVEFDLSDHWSTWSLLRDSRSLRRDTGQEWVKIQSTAAAKPSKLLRNLALYANNSYLNYTA